MSNESIRTEYLKVRLTKAEYDGLKKVCKDEGVTVSRLIQQTVRELALQSPVGEWE